MPLDAVYIKNLCFAWPRSAPILSIPLLRIKQGQHVYLKGVSGSGKSTLLGLLSGIQTDYQGYLAVLGQDLSCLNSLQRDRFRADHLGYIFQQFNLVPYLSVLENVLLGIQFSKRKRKKLKDIKQAKRAGQQILSDLQLSPSCIHAPVYTLSIGQQQRVAAARALLGAPEIILADEPTSALDIDAQLAFMELLFQECDRQNSTLIFVSHDQRLESQFHEVMDLNQFNKAAA